MKRQDDIFFGYTKLNQLVCDATFCAVMLNPNLVVLDINMNQLAMNSALIVPTDRHQLIMVTLQIENKLHLDIAIGGLILAVGFEHLPDILPI